MSIEQVASSFLEKLGSKQGGFVLVVGNCKAQMFSSINTNTNVNPFLPSPPPPPPPHPHPHPLPSFLINHTTDYNDIFLHQHNPLILTTPNFSLPAEAPFAKSMTINNNNNNNNNMGLGATNYKKPTTLKKDRHSKIRTAQGMRDRRVRLSIGIARKFFDLQDTLGFDKASKTLEWLLTKSKTSITELTNRGDGGGGGPKSSTSTSEYEVLSRTNEEQVVDIISGCPKTNKLPKPALLLHNLSKESREKARERARARTRAKLCIRKASPHTLFGISDKSVAQLEQLPSPHSLTNRASRSDNTEESILIKRKLKPHPPNFAYDQNFVTATTKDVGNNNLPSLPQSWDISSAITRSSFYAMINANLSTELQVYGKPWEAHNNNQSLH